MATVHNIGNNLTITVVDEAGEPVEGVCIEGIRSDLYSDSSSGFVVTDVNGEVTLTLREGIC